MSALGVAGVEDIVFYYTAAASGRHPSETVRVEYSEPTGP